MPGIGNAQYLIAIEAIEAADNLSAIVNLKKLKAEGIIILEVCDEILPIELADKPNWYRMDNLGRALLLNH